MLIQEQVPPALSHILFLFGLFNTCLDPLVYGFFAIHVRGQSGRICCCTQRKTEPESASVFTGSFRASITTAGSVQQTGQNWKYWPDSATANDSPGTKRELVQRRMAESFI